MKNKKQIIELLKDIRTVNLDIEQEFNFGDIEKAQNMRRMWRIKLSHLHPNILGRETDFFLKFVIDGGFELKNWRTGEVVFFDNI